MARTSFSSGNLNYQEPIRMGSLDVEYLVPVSPQRHELWQERYELGSNEKAPSSTETQDERQPNTKSREGRPRITSVPPAARIARKDVTASSLHRHSVPHLPDHFLIPRPLPATCPSQARKRTPPQPPNSKNGRKAYHDSRTGELALEKAKLAREEEEMRRRIALHARAASTS